MSQQSWFDHLLTDELVQYGLPLFLAAIALEALGSYRRGLGLYSWRDTRNSFGFMVLAGVVEFAPRQAAILLMVVLAELSPLKDVVGRQWWVWLLLFLLDDFAFYLWHSCSHKVRVLWAGHANHHSSAYMNLGTGIRAGVGERLTRMGFWLWIPLLGFDVGMMLVMMTLNLFYQFWLHTPLVGKLPKAIEAVFNTPSHHRVHHASNERYLDANHGGVLIVWDRLFGTFVEENEEDPCVYGLTKPLDPHASFLHAVTHEYELLWRDVRSTNNPLDAIRHVVCPPNWSPESGGQRQRQRYARLSLNQPA